LTRRGYLMPVDGEYRDLLSHARLAESVGIGPERVFLIEDGMAVEVSKTAAHVAERVAAGRVLVDGKSVGEIGAVVIRDRQLLAEDRVVTVSPALHPAGTGPPRPRLP